MVFRNLTASVATGAAVISEAIGGEMIPFELAGHPVDYTKYRVHSCARLVGII